MCSTYNLPHAPVLIVLHRMSPANYVDKWTTPMLIIHGSKDYGIAESEAIAAFHALQQYVTHPRCRTTLLIVFLQTRYSQPSHYVPRRQSLHHESCERVSAEISRRHECADTLLSGSNTLTKSSVGLTSSSGVNRPRSSRPQAGRVVGWHSRVHGVAASRSTRSKLHSTHMDSE